MRPQLEVIGNLSELMRRSRVFGLARRTRFFASTTAFILVLTLFYLVLAPYQRQWTSARALERAGFMVRAVNNGPCTSISEFCTTVTRVWPVDISSGCDRRMMLIYGGYDLCITPPPGSPIGRSSPRTDPIAPSYGLSTAGSAPPPPQTLSISSPSRRAVV